MRLPEAPSRRGVDFLNREISGFFDLVTDRGQKLQ
jgi:hypothetical protein